MCTERAGELIRESRPADGSCAELHDLRILRLACATRVSDPRRSQVPLNLQYFLGRCNGILRMLFALAFAGVAAAPLPGSGTFCTQPT